MRRLVVVLLAIVASASPARGQSGPLTATLKLGEPQDVVFRLGPLLISPTVQFPQVGYDSNVFDEDVDPKHDWAVSLKPNVDFFARNGVIQVVGVAASDLTYYTKYQSERSISRQLRGRLDATFSRVRPWVAGADLQLNDRPNREIDLRASRTDREISTGVAFDLSSIANVFVMAARTEERFAADESFETIKLGDALDRRTDQASAGVKLQVTPFTSVRLSGQVSRDRFLRAIDRDARRRRGAVQVEFAPEAVIRGTASVGYEDFQPQNPVTPDYRGVVSTASLVYTLLGRATIAADAERTVRHSFETARGYYVETGADLVYTQRVAGPFDFQLTGSRRWLDYTRTTPGLRPIVDSYGAGLGYRLQDGSRIAFNYEYTERIDDLRPDRTYDRRRFYASYTFER